MHYFWAKNGPFAPNKFFLKKIINITFIYLLALFIVQNLHICPNENFFRKPVNKSCFSFKPIYMPKIKVRYSSINEILTIKEY